MLEYARKIRQAVLNTELAQRAKRSSTAAAAVALVPLAMGMAITPNAAQAHPVVNVVVGSFAGTLNSDPSSNFTSNGFNSAAGDAITGEFTFDPSDIIGTFTATLTDLTSGSSFTLPAAAATSATAGATSSDYTVTAVDPLNFEGTDTPFTATFVLDLSNPGNLTSGDVTQTAAFAAGTGSLEINVPQISLDQTIGFTVNAASIPEPVSIGILGFALAGLGAVKRRAKR